jgi:hypothetical protein
MGFEPGTVDLKSLALQRINDVRYWNMFIYIIIAHLGI